MAGQEINALFVAKYLGMTYNQILDNPLWLRQIVRYASGAVRYVHGFFQNRYFQIRLISFGTAGSAHAGGVSADNDKFHGSLLLFKG
jgi:hypothetical protein